MQVATQLPVNCANRKGHYRLHDICSSPSSVAKGKPSVRYFKVWKETMFSLYVALLDVFCFLWKQKDWWMVIGRYSERGQSHSCWQKCLSLVFSKWVIKIIQELISRWCQLNVRWELSVTSTGGIRAYRWFIRQASSLLAPSSPRPIPRLLSLRLFSPSFSKSLFFLPSFVFLPPFLHPPFRLTLFKCHFLSFF